MPSNPSGPVRRSQLITPFGPGAMLTVPGGTSVVIAGLDFWFEENSSDENYDPTEFDISEWRLERLLDVDCLRLPPDYRRQYAGEQSKNSGLTIPSLRFPQWHFCSHCRLLMPVGMFTRGRIKCPDCAKEGRTRYLAQVPFIAMCEHGHMQDFPWREWVHRTAEPVCEGKLRLKTTGSATLSGQIVECDECGKKRSLGGITSGEDSGTRLSRELAPGDDFLCQGYRPWLGPEVKEPCGAPLRGSLRSASNAYFASIASSLYLPRSNNAVTQDIIRKLEDPLVTDFIRYAKELGAPSPSQIVAGLQRQYAERFAGFSSEAIERAVVAVLDSDDNEGEAVGRFEHESALRSGEFEVLRSAKDDQDLQIRVGDLSEYVSDITQYFTCINLIEKLRETRALAGFSRVFPSSGQDLRSLQGILWRNEPTGKRWLPAYTVFGEGIFFEFNEELLQEWEQRPEVQTRIAPLEQRVQQLLKKRRLVSHEITPRFVMIHTFAHLLINQLTFECGYSSASLRERLYISSSWQQPAAGVLIYTAAGDSEGTMGGLVRMGKPGYLEPVIRRALTKAQWCSADPVCMEMGRARGQGPDSCNLAACHSCSLVPETACEEFNRFLDRGVVIGGIGAPSMGFFRL